MRTLKVNGTDRTTTAQDDTPLLWVLRDDLNLTGTKFGCGMGVCGACTVHLNNTPVRSCQLPLAAIGNEHITTIEGLGSPDALSYLQQAWQAENVPQCGYCQSGQLMSAAALLGSNHSPTDRDIDVAMAGNLCRCGTYDRIRKAIHRAAHSLKEQGARHG
ncbi:Isoquinoline 1-oxidoreductase subunit alpha [compost metagenome]|jgi:isoquinoline 1-oxidoreductase alpha subunit